MSVNFIKAFTDCLSFECKAVALRDILNFESCTV